MLKGTFTIRKLLIFALGLTKEIASCHKKFSRCTFLGMDAHAQPNFKRFSLEDHSFLVEPLTELLHEAYAPLAAQGMKYLATHQPPSTTLERLLDGESFLLFLEVDLIGTVTLNTDLASSPCEYYRKPGVVTFGQFAIHPAFQGRGFGAKIMDMLEARAKEIGATEMALDTSEHAHHLIKMYEKRGYRIVSHTQWDVTNYRSVIMSKVL